MKLNRYARFFTYGRGGAVHIVPDVAITIAGRRVSMFGSEDEAACTLSIAQMHEISAATAARGRFCEWCRAAWAVGFAAYFGPLDEASQIDTIACKWGGADNKLSEQE